MGAQRISKIKRCKGEIGTSVESPVFRDTLHNTRQSCKTATFQMLQFENKQTKLSAAFLPGILCIPSPPHLFLRLAATQVGREGKGSPWASQYLKFPTFALLLGRGCTHVFKWRSQHILAGSERIVMFSSSSTLRPFPLSKFWGFF